MPSTFLGLNTGLSGLNYFQATLNTTSHNISNADVSGYSRQQVLAKAAPALRVRSSYGMMGTGVQAAGVEQLRNVYYDTKYRAATSKFSEYSGINEQLTQLQNYLNEQKSETGYTKVLSQLGAAMQNLASSPANATYRTAFTQAAGNFTDLINEVATNYQNTQEDINNEVAIHVDTINSIAAQIFTLNQQIRNIETRFGNANDLRDQRELLVDQLSELINVSVVETPVKYGEGPDAEDSGATTYEVRIGGMLLVDDMECKQLKVAAREEKVNQSDIDGLYDVYWVGLNGALGERVNFNSNNITGLMKGLLAARDGNNFNPFSGTIAEMKTGTADGSIVKISLDEGIEMDKLNLPMEGVITLNCKEYYYEGWEAEYDADGKLNNFVFKNLTITSETGRREPAALNAGMDVGREATMGQAIDCKGIPYYMTELNEFVRTLSNYMNDIFTSGADANGDRGLDFFTAADIAGNDYVLTAKPGTPAPTKVMSNDSSYYRLTALNWAINQSVKADQTKVVVSYKEDITQGNLDAKGVLEKIIAGFDDRSMYSQGTVSQFLQSITTSLAVDIQKYSSFANNMDEVANIIENQRLSVSSVDTNEEAASLVMYQNGYNLACKVISIMNEVYDKLINQTG
ncbi:MAG: flagellar hook-associated protein FlgK [Clostridiales bacterium]|nr:flagellar hook-associated protein FlgK [Clostridiales bacterium]